MNHRNFHMEIESSRAPYDQPLPDDYDYSYERDSIILSTSEDGLEIDASEYELEKIATKYAKRRNEEQSKRFMVFTSTVILIFILTTFTFLHSRTKLNHTNDGHKPHEKKRFPNHPAFRHVRSKFIPDYQASMHLYRHVQTQAEFIAFRPVDETQDKVFGISFRTKPTDNTGVAHILEHSVLSGSKNYPSKDPFLHLLKGSLHTYLNAMTYNDRTVFPVASRNKKDFNNLMSVYLDAVFYPNCVQEDGQWVLKQEGWRYDVVEEETNVMSDIASETNINATNIDAHEKKEKFLMKTTAGATATQRKELEVKGVVYSEMKGVFSNPESVIYRHTDKYLYPDSTYVYDSGGEPESIPSLTQSEFVEFYYKHYHPTNSQSFVSGTLEDIEDAMEMMDAKYLSNFNVNEQIKKDSQIQFQKKHFAHHLYQSAPYAVAKEDLNEGQHLLLITWLLNDKEMNQFLELSFYVLDYLLVGTMSSPLNKVLMDSGMGSNVIGGGLSPGLLQTTFGIGMKGVKRSHVVPLEETILNLFKDISKNGFSDDEIKAAMNSIEFDLREVHTGSNPMGLSVFLRLLAKWNYDQDPFSALEYESSLKILKAKVAKQGSKYFVKLIDDYFLSNNHRVHMELRPSQILEKMNLEAEQLKMKSFSERLSDSEYDAIVDQANLLKVIQNTEDTPKVVDMIPSLNLKDIDQSGVEYPLVVKKNAYDTDATLVTHMVDGSPGIVYIDVGMDIASIPFSEVELLPLITSILTECDTETYSREELDRMIGTYTGGISVDLVLLPVYEDESSFVAKGTKMQSHLFLRGKCTAENTETMLALFKEILEKNLMVTQEKVLQIMERKISSFKTNIASRGHSYSTMRMNARYDVQSYIDERLYGVSQMTFLQSVLTEAMDDWDNFKVRISNILDTNLKLDASSTVINLTGDESSLVNVRPVINAFITSLNTTQNVSPIDYKIENHPWIEDAQQIMSETSPLRDEGVVISSQVSYVGKAGLLYNLGEKVSGSSCVPLQYLKKGYLWDEVRAKNGAYGVMSQLGRSDGILFMVSYRDPNLLKTLDVYDAAGDFLLKEIEDKAISQKEITRAIIGCIGALDGAAVPPRSAGWISFIRYLSNSSAHRRQNWRNEILNAQQEDFLDFANRLNSRKNSTIAVVSSDLTIKDAIEHSNLQLELINAF